MKVFFAGATSDQGSPKFVRIIETARKSRGIKHRLIAYGLKHVQPFLDIYKPEKKR